MKTRLARALSTLGGATILTFVILAIPASGQSDAVDAPASSNPEGIRAKYMGFYGTGRSDWAVVSIPAMTGQPYVWKIRKNQAGPEVSETFNFGLAGDVLTPGSFTGDATFDPGIWRGGNTWFDPFDNGQGTPYSVIPFGAAADNMGRNGDYDGDGIEDITAIRIVSNVLFWWIRLSSTGGHRVVPFGSLATGQSTFAFQGADFTGDGRDELVVARSINTTGAVTWWVGDAVTGAQLFQVGWGNFNTDFLINPADYTGDGRADIVVWRAGELTNAPDYEVWYILNAATNQLVPRVWFGQGDPSFQINDLPVRGDYDGDGIHDIAVYRPTTNTYWVRASSNGTLIVQQWGGPTDVPLANFFTF